MSLVNPGVNDHTIVCQSYCYQCRIATAWKVRKIAIAKRFVTISGVDNDTAHQLSCSKCYSPLDLSGQEVKEINRVMDSAKSIQGTSIHQELNHRIERRQQACLTASRGNWLTG